MDTVSNLKRGRECEVADIVASSPLAVRKARDNTLSVKGAKMFNLLPADIRNISSNNALHIKSRLDKFLATIPDEPTSAEQGRAAVSNSLLHQLPSANINNIHGRTQRVTPSTSY